MPTTLKDLKKGPSAEELSKEHQANLAARSAKARERQLLTELEASRRRLDAALELQSRKSVTYQIPAHKSGRNEACAFMVLSDIHLEERVERKTTNGLNEYNPAIAKDSVMMFARNAVKLYRHAKRDSEIRQVVLALLGDNINGYIHEEFVEDNYMSPTQALMECTDLLASVVQYVLKQTDAEVTVVCKYGNHGRTTKKRMISTAYKNNYEWLMYHTLAKQLRHDRLRWVVEDGYLTYLTVFGKYDVRFHHGDAIRYEGGVGGLTIPANKAIAQWDRERPAYLDVFGHYHQLLPGAGRFVCNGSVIGYNPFAIFIKAAYEPPQQAFFLIDRRRGKSLTAPVWVRER